MTAKRDAGLLQGRNQHVGRKVFRAVERHVFKEVREATLIFVLEQTARIHAHAQTDAARRLRRAHERVTDSVREDAPAHRRIRNQERLLMRERHTRGEWWPRLVHRRRFGRGSGITRGRILTAGAQDKDGGEDGGKTHGRKMEHFGNREEGGSKCERLGITQVRLVVSLRRAEPWERRTPCGLGQWAVLFMCSRLEPNRGAALPGSDDGWRGSPCPKTPRRCN